MGLLSYYMMFVKGLGLSELGIMLCCLLITQIISGTCWRFSLKRVFLLFTQHKLSVTQPLPGAGGITFTLIQTAEPIGFECWVVQKRPTRHAGYGPAPPSLKGPPHPQGLVLHGPWLEQTRVEVILMGCCSARVQSSSHASGDKFNWNIWMMMQ